MHFGKMYFITYC